jgi:hypothetical protein
VSYQEDDRVSYPEDDRVSYLENDGFNPDNGRVSFTRGETGYPIKRMTGCPIQRMNARLSGF